MEGQRSKLFQLEDGPSLSVAVHSQVPQHEYVCALIRENGGVVIADALSADFCILSFNISNVGALADKLLSEGKLAVQDYWIRDSVDAATLLPWYSYQVMPSPFALGDISQGSGMLSVRDVEKRDIHQLVVTAARHGAVLLANDLYKHISRKCPHRSAESFRFLYETNRLDIEPQIVYLRQKLEGALGLSSSFYKQPIFSFESPNKDIPFRVQAAPALYGRASLLTPSTTADSREEAGSTARSSIRHTFRPTTNNEAPYDPPNMAHAPESTAPPSRRPEGHKETANRVTRGAAKTKGVESERQQRTQSSAGKNSQPTVRVKASKATKHSSSRPHGGITEADKLALAKFVAQNPQGKKSWPEFMAVFAKQYRRGSVRSAWSWRHVYKRDDVKKMIKNISKEKRGPEPAEEGKAPLRRDRKDESEKEDDNSDDDSEEGEDSGSEESHARPPPTVKLTHQQVNENCQKDKPAIAKWMMKHPKDAETTYKVYFKRFQEQHRSGSVRTPEQWKRFIERHAQAISRIQQSLGAKNQTKSSSSPEKVTEEDKQALALWMVDNRVTSTFPAYFEAFSKQYRGSTRSPGAWTTVARRISDELDELKRKILHERKMTQGEKQLETKGRAPTAEQRTPKGEKEADVVGS